MALLQLLACQNYTSIKQQKNVAKYSNYLFIPIIMNNLQGNQHLGVPQKCGGLKPNLN